MKIEKLTPTALMIMKNTACIFALRDLISALVQENDLKLPDGEDIDSFLKHARNFHIDLMIESQPEFRTDLTLLKT